MTLMCSKRRLPLEDRETGCLDASGRVSEGSLGRYARELAWLTSLPALSHTAKCLLAARIAASAAASEPVSARAARSLPAQLLGGRCSALSLQESACSIEWLTGPCSLTQADISTLCRVWPLVVSTETLLASGGDERLTLDPATGLNRYGCAPRPRTGLISFGSCTASSLTAGAFAAAEDGRRQLIRAALTNGWDRAVEAASHQHEEAILRAFGAVGVADAILTASGTDAALVVTGLIAAEHPDRTFTSIVVSPAETGSGVPLAVQGRHFAGIAPSGCTVPKGEPISGLAAQPRLLTIALRDATGRPLSAGDVASACEAAIGSAMPYGRVVLHAIDGSKTGLTAPDQATLVRLAQRYGQDLDIVIDACQARVEPIRVRAYLAAGFPVLVTGSKFFGAPGFCGAVLVPRGRLARLRASGSLPAGLAAYASPDGGLGSRRCAGLLLRWTAALHEMDRFAALADDEVRLRLACLGKTLGETLRSDNRLHMVAAPRPAGMGWSDQRSVFTFTVDGTQGAMPPERLRDLYLAMQRDISDTPAWRGDPALAALPCQIGQPVQLGSPVLGGLRIAFSSAQIVDGADQAGPLSSVFDKLRLLLDADESNQGVPLAAA